jgi:hypothetical protein
LGSKDRERKTALLAYLSWEMERAFSILGFLFFEIAKTKNNS